MAIYSLLAITSFSVCLALGLFFVPEAVPSETDRARFLFGFFCLASLWFPVAIGFFVQLCKGNYLKGRPKTRIVVGFVLGVGTGIAVAGLCAMFGKYDFDNSLKLSLNAVINAPFNDSDVTALQERVHLIDKARTLYSHAEIISRLARFTELEMPLAAVFGLIHVITIEFSNKEKLSPNSEKG
jgi:hypothetical protein